MKTDIILQNLGVKHPGEAEYLQAELNTGYSYDRMMLTQDLQRRHITLALQKETDTNGGWRKKRTSKESSISATQQP